jgi:predicted metal-dependent RNase
MEETSLKFTPFFGGKESSGTQVQALGQFQSSAGAYCSLLEIGDTRVLLDCGCLSTFNEEKINQFRDDVCDALDGKSLDCILISHAGNVME